MFNRVLLRQSKFLANSHKINSVICPTLSSHSSKSMPFRYNVTRRNFGSDNKEDKKVQNEKVEHKSEEHEEDFKHDSTYDEDTSANFSTRRRIFFALGKAIKYSIWTYCVLFAYHFYLVRKKEKPEEAFG